MSLLDESDLDPRQHAAALIRSHFEGTVTLDELAAAFRSSQDPLVRIAVDLVYQQPKRGFLGVREQHWNKVYWPRVLYILEQLEAGDAAVVPPAPLYPAATRLRIFGVFLFLILILLTSAEGALQIYRHMTGEDRLSAFSLCISLLRFVAFGYLALRGVGGLRYRIWLFRQWRDAPPIRFASYTGEPGG